jgi:hypothetical protein
MKQTSKGRGNPSIRPSGRHDVFRPHPALFNPANIMVNGNTDGRVNQLSENRGGNGVWCNVAHPWGPRKDMDNSMHPDKTRRPCHAYRQHSRYQARPVDHFLSGK